MEVDLSSGLPAESFDTKSDRPTGNVPMAIGWISMLLGLFLYFASANGSAPAVYLSAALFPFGLFVWAVGYVVSAIAHIPGRL
jgi:hypothetical protein